MPPEEEPKSIEPEGDSAGPKNSPEVEPSNFGTEGGNSGPTGHETPPSPEPPEKPEYQSPLTYEIRNPDELWEYFKDGTFAASGEIDRGHIRIDPDIKKLNARPSIFFEKGKFSLRIPIQGENFYPLQRNPVPGLEPLFHQFIDENMSTQESPNTGLDRRYLPEIYRTLPDGRKEKIADCSTGYIGEFTYAPSETRIEGKEQFLRELELALKLYRIYTSELYKANGLPVPEEKVIIEAQKKWDDEKLFESNLSDIFSKKYSKSYKDEVKKLFGTEQDQNIETLRRSIVVENRPDTVFEDVAGQPDAVEAAKTLGDQISDPEFFKSEGVKDIRGILLHGPPGTGKTLIARALAHEANCASVSVKASDIASKWLGDSEKLAAGIFVIARQEAEKHPSGQCILFIDEADTILPSRGGKIHEATGKVIGTFLTEMEGLETKGGVIVIAATNKPENLDEAFLSRMSERVHVPNPNAEGIAKIFGLHFEKACKRANKSLVGANVNFQQIAHELAGKGISGRDIADIVDVATRTRARKLFQAKKEGKPLGPELITEEDIKEAIKMSGKVEEAKERKEERERRFGFPIPQR